ncbi:BrnT family toxin [Sphingomonas sp.]|uniref:BrnT family toxin n=1 Tax=Sphingomonas sp. TaxID=28214 RepID=UPI0035BC8BFA
MPSEFDPDKNVVNIAKHGVPLTFGDQVIADPDHVIIPTTRMKDEEFRFKAVGLVNGKLWTAIHVHRGPRIRFISVRRSNDGERRIYNRA